MDTTKIPNAQGQEGAGMSKDDPLTGDGLRERKRAATREAITRAAITLALEHGYEQVTVDMICDAAMVSQRTFFNYFGSKEGVIIGTAPAEPTPEQIDAFTHKRGPGVLADLVGLIADSLDEHDPDVTLLHARREVVQRSPELMDAELAKITDLEDRSTQIVLTRLRNQGHPGSERELEDEARMVVSLAGGVMRYLMRSWSTGDPAASPRDLLREAITVLRRFADSELRASED